MWLEILAAAAAVTGPQGDSAPTTVSGVVVTGAAPVAAKVEVGGDSSSDVDLVTVWPMGAYQTRTDGQVKLSCWVDIFGLAESCHVISESPEGKGFGAAALQLRQTLKLKPATGQNGPIGSTMTISIRFKAPPESQFGVGGVSAGGIPSSEGAGGNIGAGVQIGNPLTMRQVTMLDHPIWAQAASFEDLTRAYPAAADGVEGYAVAHCHVEHTGLLNNCQVIKETPDNLGFGAAAVSLARQFRVSPAWTTPPSHAELWVDVPIRFPAPGDAGERTVASPTWLQGVDPDTAPQLFPPEAAAKGLTTGAGLARCVVKPDGGLSDCTPEAGDPDGLGFSEAAVKLASVMKMNPWSADASPVDGAVIRVKVRLNLKAPG